MLRAAAAVVVTIILTVIVAAALFLLAPKAHAAAPTTYDRYFERWAPVYMPGVDPLLLKAQCYQESRLNPRAVSPVGAQGLCQFMPGTWREATPALRIAGDASPFNPELSVQAAAWYMAKLRKVWSSPRPEGDRHRLALASYNAGAGHIIKAQKACGGPMLYEAIMLCLPRITGPVHSKETAGYAPAIYKHYQKLLLGVL